MTTTDKEHTSQSLPPPITRETHGSVPVERVVESVAQITRGGAVEHGELLLPHRAQQRRCSRKSAARRGQKGRSERMAAATRAEKSGDSRQRAVPEGSRAVQNFASNWLSRRANWRR